MGASLCTESESARGFYECSLQIAQLPGQSMRALDAILDKFENTHTDRLFMLVHHG